jgi:hypothetical protein
VEALGARFLADAGAIEKGLKVQMDSGISLYMSDEDLQGLMDKLQSFGLLVG